MSAWIKGLRAFGRTVQHRLGLGWLTPQKPGDVEIVLIDEHAVGPGERRNVTLRGRDGGYKIYFITPGCHYDEGYSTSVDGFAVIGGGVAHGAVWHDRAVSGPIVGYIAIPV